MPPPPEGGEPPLAAPAVQAPARPGAQNDELPDVEAFGGLGFLDDDYVHVGYRFSSSRQGVRRWGEGELWLSFEGEVPRVRLKGYAYSPRFGHGEITLVLDSKVGMMYALLQLGELREAQCMSFPFPRSDGDSSRLERLRWRKDQVALHWRELPSDRVARAKVGASDVLAVNWTKSYTLDLLLSDSPRKVKGVDLRQGPRVVKFVMLEEVHDAEVQGSNGKATAAGAGKGPIKQNTSEIFAKPASHCPPVSEVTDPLLMVEIKPPHHRSSALGDLLLVLADRAAGGNWPRAFVALCAVVVPGDVAVMIEEPNPPDLGKLSALAFDYRATVFHLGGNVSFDDPAEDLRHGSGNHNSEGSLRLDLAGRSLELHGEERQTKVGPVVTDLLAHVKGDAPKLFAYVQMPAQGERRCGAYDFPAEVPHGGVPADLEHAAGLGLTFVGVNELHGEDCGIFAAELPRDRRVYIWVDLESDRPGEFLRAEVRKRGRRLRSLDVIQWHGVASGTVQVEPPKEWNCTEEFGKDPFVHLGLRDLQQWSIQLQDAMRSLRDLPQDFLVLEMLALAGDVCLMVKEPEAPELWRLPALSFGFIAFLGDSELGPRASTHGRFAVDHQRGRLLLSAETPGFGDSDGISISLSIAEGFLSVRVQQSNTDSCLKLPLDHPPTHPAKLPANGVFDGVELIEESECDRFSFQGLGPKALVRFWLSKALPTARDGAGAAAATASSFMHGSVRQLQVLPTQGGGQPTLVVVSDWEESYQPQAPPPNEWDCKPVSEAEKPWIGLAAGPTMKDRNPDRLSPPSLQPTSEVLARLVQATEILGITSQQWAADALSRLFIHQPQPPVAVPTTTTTPAPLSLFSPELESFSFSFSSTYMQAFQEFAASHGSNVGFPGSGHHGKGELSADLVRRQLYLRSVATNVSTGIARLESEVYFSAQHRRLYARTRLTEDGYEQCWSLGAPSLEPAPGGHDGRKRGNPFLRGTLAGRGDNAGLDKYVLPLDPGRRVELFVDSHSALCAMHIHDKPRGATVGIIVNDWSSQPFAHVDPSTDWSCPGVTLLDWNNHILAWDIIRLIFPGEL